MLLPPPFSCLRMPLPIKSWISRKAVSCELFVSFAHFSVVNFPSKPSSNRLTIFFRRSLTTADFCLSRRQNASFFQDPARWHVCFFNCATKAVEKPSQPIGYVHSVLLYFQESGSSSVALRGFGKTCDRDSSIAIRERMNRDEVKMC